jgi:hypothetical protein
MPARKKTPKPTTANCTASILIAAGDTERMASAALNAAQRPQCSGEPCPAWRESPRAKVRCKPRLWRETGSTIVRAFKARLYPTAEQADRLNQWAGCIKGMMRNPDLALSVADAAVSRLVTLCAYEADWRGRQLEKIDPWFPSTQACCQCGCINTDMKNLNRRTFTCAEFRHVEGRDRNAARNVYRYGEERRSRICEDTTRGQIGEQGHALGLVLVPIVETRIEAHGGHHESQ